MPDQEPESILLIKHANGAWMSVQVFNEPVEGADPSDRIKLIFRSEGKNPRGYLMNAIEALQVINGLSAAIERVIREEMPLKTQYK